MPLTHQSLVVTSCLVPWSERRVGVSILPSGQGSVALSSVLNATLHYSAEVSAPGSGRGVAGCQRTVRKRAPLSPMTTSTTSPRLWFTTGIRCEEQRVRSAQAQGRQGGPRGAVCEARRLRSVRASRLRLSPTGRQCLAAVPCAFAPSPYASMQARRLHPPHQPLAPLLCRLLPQL